MHQMYSVEDLLADETFTDYCLNENSPHLQKWRDLISVNPDLAKTAAEAKAMLAVLSPSLSANEIASEVEKLREVIEARPVPVVKKRWSKLAYSIAAVVVVLLVGGVGYYFSTDSKGLTPNLSEFKTGLGERKQYILPDGSTVILNSNSTFSFDKSFGRHTREIHLTGGAFFKVAKNASKPFVVKSNGFYTTAIGTAFYVNSESTTEGFSVDLLEGKVKLEKDATGEVLYLAPGEKASWADSASAFARQSYDTTSLKKWVKGVLSFDNTPVDEVFRQLEAWYDVKIQDGRENHEIITITGDYVNVPLEDVLKIICFSLSSTYQYEGGMIIIQ